MHLAVDQYLQRLWGPRDSLAKVPEIFWGHKNGMRDTQTGSNGCDPQIFARDPATSSRFSLLRPPAFLLPTPNEGEATNNDHKSTLPGSSSVHRDFLSLSLSPILCKSARIDHRALSRLRRRGDMHPPYREAISSRCSLKKKSTDRFFFHLKDHSFAPPSPLIQGALPPGKRTRLRVRVLRRQSSH